MPVTGTIALASAKPKALSFRNSPIAAPASCEFNLLDTLIKICGITREVDAQAAVDAGAHALGFIFYQPSSRFIEAERAQSIIDTLPPFVTTVAVLVNQSRQEVESLLKKVSVNLLQLHGEEPAELCDAYGAPYIKALRIRHISQAGNAAKRFPNARGLLLDTLVAAEYGGTGECFSWERLPRSVTKPVVLAGGLNADNVAHAIRTVKPYGVDVSTGVETARGKKDAIKIQQFVQAVRAARLNEETSK